MKQVWIVLFLLAVMPVVGATVRLQCDVAVVGGGSAGFAAAWSAAKRGIDVVLVEREDALGGTSTIGGVSSWEPVCGARGLPELVYERLKKEGKAGVYRFVHHRSWPEKDGASQFPGALLEIDRDAPYSVTLRRHGPGIVDEKWFRENCRGVIFDPDAMSRTMREMLGETRRCRVMTGTSFVSAERESGSITTLHLSDGTVLEPKVVVDACGAVAKSVGCELMNSDRPNGASLIYRVARSDGVSVPFDPPPRCWWREGYPSAFCMVLPNGEVVVNMLPTISGEEVWRLGESAAYEESRRRVEAHWRWMQMKWPAFSEWRISRISPRLAQRETFRIRGDYVLTGDDVRRGVRPADEIASADHALDAHGGEGFGGELKAPYGIPYRCLVAAGMENLLLAGRIASFDTWAASSCRLSRTMMKIGEAAGVAAALSVEGGRSIRQVESAEIRNVVAMAARRLHGAEKTRRFVLADESRPRLHYWDSSDPAKCFSIPGERPMWDLKKVGNMKYRAVCKKGFKVFDIRERKVVDEFVHPLLDEVTAVCDMPDGGFVASVNPQFGPDKRKVVLLRRFSAARELVATYRCEGFFYARSLQWDRDYKTLLLSWEKGFARIRIPATGDVCEVVGDFRQPKGRNLFDVVPEMSGGGYIAGCGYKGGLVRFDKDGKARSVWFVPDIDGSVSFFYAQTHEMSDGHVYMAHWTGHGADDSKKGWQVVEFDGDGRVVWHLYDPARFGSISGIDVLP